MANLRNVIVFVLGGVRMATELRFVREVATLGFVTRVPSAPVGVAGVCNLHGNIVPVLDVTGLTTGQAGGDARQGDGALLVELDGLTAAIRVDQIDEVATLATAGNAVLDHRGQRLALVDPRELLARATAAIASAAPRAPGAT